MVPEGFVQESVAFGYDTPVAPFGGFGFVAGPGPIGGPNTVWGAKGAIWTADPQSVTKVVLPFAGFMVLNCALPAVKLYALK